MEVYEMDAINCFSLESLSAIHSCGHYNGIVSATEMDDYKFDTLIK